MYLLCANEIPDFITIDAAVACAGVVVFFFILMKKFIEVL